VQHDGNVSCGSFALFFSGNSCQRIGERDDLLASSTGGRDRPHSHARPPASLSALLFLALGHGDMRQPQSAGGQGHQLATLITSVIT
jgi:hypothetical protein